MIIFSSQRVNSLSLSLDSIAQWGKFPRFCINTYRWGDKFFNTYDSTFVQGTGYKFNVKLKADTWTDSYIFSLPDSYRMNMHSDWCTSFGGYVTYLAVSLGYDMNVSKYFGGGSKVRKRFTFNFNCALGCAELYWTSNDVGTTITRFGPTTKMNSVKIPFSGINTQVFGVDAYYFLNNKKYSRGAAFNFSKIQKRSQGSFFMGFSYWNQQFDFDFQQLSDEIKATLPESWAQHDYKYNASNHNYAIRAGYGYNWVFAPHWLLGVSASPVIGIKHGYINEPGHSSNSFSLYAHAKMSVVWNNRHWFSGVIINTDNGLIHDKNHQLLSGIHTIEASVGYRFNLW